MATITIGATTFEVYAALTDAEAYMAGCLETGDWDAAGDSLKEKALIVATRILNQQRWKGSPTDTDTPQPLAWPRTGVTDKNGLDVDDATTPQDLLDGYFELAKALVEDPALAKQATDRNTQKRVKAGDVEVEYFAPATPVEQGTRLPFHVHEMVRQYLGGGSSLSMGLASGTCETSDYGDGQRFQLTRGLS